MDQQIRKKSYPTSVLKLYIKLYCKKRNASKFKMMEAIKSWTTLKQSERDEFMNKYKECQINHKKKLANYLSKMQPYLKEKNPKRTLSRTKTLEEEEGARNEGEISETQNDSTQNMVDICQPGIQMDIVRTSCDKDETPNLPTAKNYSESSSNVLAETLPPSATVSSSIEEEQIIRMESDNEDEISERQNNSMENIVDISQPAVRMDIVRTSCDEDNSSNSPTAKVDSESSRNVLSEPLPPTTTNARELFEMIKDRNKESTETWKSLSNLKKSRYRKAVFLLKADYLNKFKSYLESLPSKKLFDYYNDYFH